MKLSFKPDEHMRWIYNPSHPDYNTDHARSLRAARGRAIMAAPHWMKWAASFNDAMSDAAEDGGKK